MDLRAELLPPALDETKVRRLAKLAARIDGAQPGQWEDELAEFNALAGTFLEFRDFQGIYKAEEHNTWVRRLLYQQILKRTANLSHAEMVEIVLRILACGEDHEFYVQLFEMNCRHPSGCDLIFWPKLVPELPKEREPTAQEIADCALNWEPRVVTMQVKQRSGGVSVGYYIYELEAPDTPRTRVVTALDVAYEPGAVVAVALKGVRLDDGSEVDTTFAFGPMSCGRILGTTDQPVGSRMS